MIKQSTCSQSMSSVAFSLQGKVLARLSIFFASVLLIATCWLTAPTSASAMPLEPVPIVSTLLSFPGTRPANLGVADGQFAPCPTTPNCVSSQSPDQEHAIAPLRYTSTPEAAFHKLQALLQSQPRVNILSTTDNYIRAEFTIPIVGFVDDVEFSLDREAKLIHVRSASRMGESDLGVNRKRIETIRMKLDEA